MMEMLQMQVGGDSDSVRMGGFARFQVETALTKPSVEAACRHLHMFARQDDEEDVYVTEFYTRLTTKWPNCQPHTLVDEMVRRKYVAHRQVGEGGARRCRLYLLTSPPKELPKRSLTAKRMVTRIQAAVVGRRISHGSQALCTTELEYRLIRQLERAAEPQPSHGWNFQALRASEVYTLAALRDRLLTPVALLEDALARCVSTGVISRCSNLEAYGLAMNPQNLFLRRLQSRPIYLVSAATLKMVERAAEVARIATDPDGTISDLTAYIKLVAEEWSQTQRSVWNRLTAKLTTVRGARSPFEQLVSIAGTTYPVPPALGWCDLLVDDRISHSKRLTARDAGYIQAYSQVCARYAPMLAK